MSANERQVGGDHYKSPGKVEHWDMVAQHDLDYFQGQITKYVMRWKKKNGVDDLRKAQHFLEKYIELNAPPPSKFIVSNDDGATALYVCKRCAFGFRATSMAHALEEHQKLAPNCR